MEACVSGSLNTTAIYDSTQEGPACIAGTKQTRSSLRPTRDRSYSFHCSSCWSMALDPGKPSWRRIRAATKELLTENSGGSWGDFKSGVALRLNVPVECLKPWKTKMKQIVAEGVKEGHPSDEEEDEGCSSDSGEQGRDEESEEDTSTGGHSSKARASEGEEDSAAMRAFKRMSRAMSLG